MCVLPFLFFLCVTAKKGLAVDSGLHTCSDIQTARSAISWWYDWNLTPPHNFTCGSDLFVPMAWGKSSASKLPGLHLDTLLGFNEPNLPSQSNMSPEEAALLWPKLEATGARVLGSPAAAPCGKCLYNDTAWFDKFFSLCQGCKVDFIATHYYGCKEAGLRAHLDSLRRYRKPIWLTEFNCGGGSFVTDPRLHLAWMKVALPILEADTDVARYAWMSTRDNHNNGARLWDDNGITLLGEFYLKNK